MSGDSADDHVSRTHASQLSPQTHGASNANILAHKFGKFNSMCCLFHAKTQGYRFHAVATPFPSVGRKHSIFKSG